MMKRQGSTPDIKKLYDEQVELAKKAILSDSFDRLDMIGGLDCSYIDDEYIIGGLVVFDRRTKKPVHHSFVKQKLDFPYIPGLLAYREADVMINAVKRSPLKPDVLMIDGFGTNHPRRCGIATHIGIKLDMPAIGVGKSFLCGTIEGDDIYQDGEKVGRLIYTKGFKKPIYVSPGHKMSLDTAVEVAAECIIKGKIPEPVRLAHEYVTLLKKADIEL